MEHLHLSVSADGAEAVGTVLRMQPPEDGRCCPEHLRCRYELATDPQWCFRQLSLALLPDRAEETPRRLELEADGQGRWRHDGEARADLEGCIDIDIQVTPFTNSLPIRRLGLRQGETVELKMAYVCLPSLSVEARAQRYTCLEPLGESGGRYRYEGPIGEFEAELPVDGDGLVMDYPALFRRIWPT